MNIKKLSQIWIYPIKSLAGISIQKSTVLPKGLQYDRRWMLVDENGRFLTQREYPEMALFKVAIENSFLLVSKSDTIRIALNGETSGESIKVQIWKNEVLAIEVNRNYSFQTN